MRRLLLPLLVGLALLGTACSDDAFADGERDDSGNLTEAGDVGVFALRVGDCFQVADVVGAVVSEVGAVPCDEPHTGEILSVETMTGSDFPGLAATKAFAEDACLAAFERISGVDFFADPDWDMTFLHPTEQSWEQIGDRDVLCVVAPLDGQPITRSFPREL